MTVNIHQNTVVAGAGFLTGAYLAYNSYTTAGLLLMAMSTAAYVNQNFSSLKKAAAKAGSAAVKAYQTQGVVGAAGAGIQSLFSTTPTSHRSEGSLANRKVTPLVIKPKNFKEVAEKVIAEIGQGKVSQDLVDRYKALKSAYKDEGFLEHRAAHATTYKQLKQGGITFQANIQAAKEARAKKRADAAQVKSSAPAVAISLIHRTSPHFQPFTSKFPKDMVKSILVFLGDKDLRSLDSVSHYFRSLINSLCDTQSKQRGLIPAALPAGVNFKQLLLNRFPNAIGLDCIKKKLGAVGAFPPIPSQFIARTRPGFKLVPVPEYITINVGADSPLMLDKSTAIGELKPRLIEAPDKAPKGKARKIRVPITPNNIILLARTFCPQFSGLFEHSWENVLNQNGDVGVGPSHWSYQKDGVIGLGETYQRQSEMAREDGLEIVPLADRIWFHLLSHVYTGKIPQHAYFERTSTVTRDDQNNPWQSTIWWQASGPLFRLSLSDDYGIGDVGAAVGAPAGSSLAIGH